jgi:hypothetical protein
LLFAARPRAIYNDPLMAHAPQAAPGRGPSGQDRADFAGEACISPLASGEAFPVKVVFAIQGGQGVPAVETAGLAHGNAQALTPQELDDLLAFLLTL